jgi:hypothetical protein
VSGRKVRRMADSYVCQLLGVSEQIKVMLYSLNSVRQINYKKSILIQYKGRRAVRCNESYVM